MLPTWKQSATLNLDKMELVATCSRQKGSVHNFTCVTTISCAKIHAGFPFTDFDFDFFSYRF